MLKHKKIYNKKVNKIDKQKLKLKIEKFNL